MPNNNQVAKLRIVGLVILFIGCLFLVRLFHLQVILSGEYRRQADAGQIKSLAIEARRGGVYAYNGDRLAPLVLNERRWLVFADAEFINNPGDIIGVLSDNGISLSQEQKDSLYGVSRYIILTRNIDDPTKSAIESADVAGMYFQERHIRSYPEGGLATHVLGFLNADSVGQYGVEQMYNQDLTGTPGQLKAVTDTRGVPLVFEEGNIAIEPQAGHDLILTLDIPLQSAVEKILATTVSDTDALSGSVVILDPSDGAIRAMANYPTYNPADFGKVKDLNLYKNQAISHTFEPGSVIKTLVMTAVLDKGLIGIDSVYQNPANRVIDGSAITNATYYAPSTRPISDILTYSLNTGAIYLLEQLGGGELNATARQLYYDYLTGPFRLTQKTGIDLPGEEHGFVGSPHDGYALNLRYANMTFGQGLTVTSLQLAALHGALFNGGKYYQPYIVQQIGDTGVAPKVLDEQIVAAPTLDKLEILMDRLAAVLFTDVQFDGIATSGKTGTAEIADENGGYIDDAFTGTFVGYIKSGEDTLIISIRIDRPQVVFAGFYGAVPIYRQIVEEVVKLGAVTR